MTAPVFADILAARDRIAGLARRTPVLTCGSIDRIAGCEIHFKCENFQKVGAFKIRGATNAVMSLGDDEAAGGVATHSSGNHAAALALAARWRGISAHVVMPENSPRVKVEAVRGYGAEITFCAPNLRAREEGLARVLDATGAVPIHPYDDPRVVAGQGTAALELCEDAPGLDAVLAPVGGGGLVGGTSLAVGAILPGARVYACEPANADDARRSFLAGRRIPVGKADTVADGLRTSLGEVTFPLLRDHVTDVLTVSEDRIVAAMRLVWERMKIVIEPSSAVPLAALLANPELFAGLKAGIIVSGGNVDLDRLPWRA